MPSYSYRCSAGHVTDRTYATSGDKKARIRCSCGRSAPFSYKDTFGGGHLVSKGDGIEHWNAGLGEYIRGDSHLKQRQKVRGTHDWEPDQKRSPATVL